MKRVIALMVFFSLALAGTIEVKKAESLSLFLGGSLVVLEGRPVVLVRDGQTLSARRVIYDRKARRLTLSGQVRYTDDQGRTIEAKELVLFVGDESLVATNVKVRSGDFDFESPFAYRSQGQITMQAAYFSPCLAKGQNPPDYAFFAQQVTLFPGDRIVARGVWVSLFGQKQLYLPVLVIFTGKRAPRIYLGQSAVDGLVAGADLPYVTKNGLGFTLLRYFEKRGLGVGLDHWGAGSAYEHYRFLYLPPEPGKDRGTLSLSLDYRKEEDGWSGQFSLTRDDAVVPGRFTLSAEVKKTDPDDPFVRFSIERILDTDPAAPPPWGFFKGPEVELAYRKARRLGDLTISGRAIVGGYEGESNPLNRSARREGPRIGAGRVYLEHHERYAPRFGGGLAFRLQNDFVGYYYSTGERQINWRTTATLSQRLGSFELGTNLERWVREGETPFIFDRIPTRRTIELSPYLRYRQSPLALSISGGWSFDQNAPLPLKGDLSLRTTDLSARILAERRLERTEGRLNAQITYAPRPASFGVRFGYRLGEDRYDPLDLSFSYALPGGSVFLSHRYDPNLGQGVASRAAFLYRQANFSLSLGERYDHRSEVLSGSARLGLGPWQLSLTHSYAVPDGKPDAEDAVEGRLIGQVALSRGGSRLALLGQLTGQGLEKGELVGSLSQQSLEAQFHLEARLHLPDPSDAELYLSRLSARGGIDLTPDLAIQGGLGYQKGTAGETLSFEDFGLSARLWAQGSTQIFLAAFLNQRFDLGSKTAEPIKPRIVFTYDRACWGARLTLDAIKDEVRLALFYQGFGGGVTFGPSGIGLSGVNLP